MTKTIRSRGNGAGSFILPLSSNPAGHTNPLTESLKQLLNASVIYTKDVILTTVTTDYEIETTQENLDLLNEVSNFPNIEDVLNPPDTTSPDILNNNITYVSENIQTPFLSLRSNEEVEWSIIGGIDQNSFDISRNNLLQFKQVPDYENPHSFGGTNIYTIQIQAADNAGNKTLKIMTIVVQDEDDSVPPPVVEPEPEPEPETPANNNDIINNIINTNEIINTITITTEEIIENVGEPPALLDSTFTENDLKDLYNELVKGFLVKGPLYLPHANIVNGLYARLKKSIDEEGRENINLFLYRDVIDILFKTKNIFIHNIGIEKQLKVMRKKYKENLCSVNELKEQLRALDPNGEKGLGFEGSLGIKMRKFKPAIYHQALFNLPLAWYIYLHDTTDIVPSLYYMTTQYIKQFDTKQESHDKLIQLLDEKYLDEDGDLEATSSSSNTSSSSSSNSSSDTPPCGSSSSSSDSEPDIQPEQKQDDCPCEDNIQYDECGNPIIETDDCGNPIGENSCGSGTIDVSQDGSEISTSTTTGGAAEESGVLAYFYDETLNNAIFFISGSFSLTQTKKSSKKPKTVRRKYYPKRKTRKVPFAPFGNPNGKPMVRNDDGTYSFFMDGRFEIVLKKRYRCVNKRKTKKHYSYCSLNQTFKNN